MKRILLAFGALFLSILACDLESTPTPAPTPVGPPPTLPPIQPTGEIISPSGYQTVILEDDLNIASGEWVIWAEEPSIAGLSNADGAIRVEFDVKPQTAAVLIRQLHDLPDNADGMTLTILAEGRPFHMVVGLKEEDGSGYQTSLWIDPVEGERTVEISFDWLRPSADSKDENNTLDYDQVVELDMIDISGYIGPVGAGALEVRSLVFWQGMTTSSITQCSSDATPSVEFLVGVDANFIPQGEQNGVMWYVGDTQVDPLVLFAKQGVQSLRLRVWVGEDGPTKLDYATQLARRAHDNGMQVYPVLFLSEDWADVNKQPAPKDWKKLSLEERAGVIREYAEETVNHLLETGIEVPYYAIGNEIDFGISGVFAELDQRDLNTLETTIWPQEAALIQAAVEGVREADPEARIMLHIAHSFNRTFAIAFFSSMRDLSVEYDIAGLSFYPTAFGPLAVEGFCETLDRLGSELGLEIVIPEFAYPGEIPYGGMFGDWHNDLPGYPLTHEGQAQWLADFLASLRNHPNVIGAYYFSPAFHWSGELWGPFALFDEDGKARPAVGAFSLP